MDGDPTWRVSHERHRLGFPVLGSYVGETNFLAGWRITGINSRATGFQDSTLEKHVHAGLSLRQSEERSALAAAKFPMITSPSKSQGNAWVLLTPHHNTALDLG